MGCDRYLTLLALRLEDALTEEEARGLDRHLSRCPSCRAAGAQLAALQGAFPELEEIEAPEGFAQGVMDRVRAEASPKVIPLFKRPQFRALAGLAACAALVVGLYGASQPRKEDSADMMLRSFNRDAITELDSVAAQECLPVPKDGEAPVYGFDGTGSAEDVPQITAYAAPPEDPSAGTARMEKAALGAVSSQSYVFQNDQYIWMSYDGYTPEPGARIIGSVQSLEDFLAQFARDDFSEVQAWYDEGYFETGRLLAVVVTEPSGSIRHRISELLRDQVVIEQTSPARTDDLAAWLILAEVGINFSDGDQLELKVVPFADESSEIGLMLIPDE